MVKGEAKERSTLSEIVTREYTIHLHKLVHGTQFKKRAPKAMKCIRAFASSAMKTTDVRLDPELNKAMWANGIKTVPHRVRVRISRKRNDNEDAKEKLYAFVEFVNVVSFKGLQNETIDDE